MNKVDNKMKDYIKDKTILITGGTGFLGRSLVSKLLEYDPQSLRIFSRDEVKHYRFNRIFGDHSRIRNLIGDVRDYKRILRASEGVDIIIHAAALKRIDLLEYNVSESIKTNVMGTLNVARVALKNNVDRALFVSTDKACSPVNSYGACKMLGERIFTEMNYSKGQSPTVLSSVRYGNVLASTGSVVPFFKKKIEGDEPIPLTHPEMTRFIISVDQAVSLVLKSMIYSIGGEVMIPRLPSTRIVDLIQVLKNAANADNEVVEVGIRPGEKIHEMLINELEMRHTYEYEDIYVIESMIEKYQKGIQTPRYKSDGKDMSKASINRYCSKDHLISQDSLEQLLKDFGLL